MTRLIVRAHLAVAVALPLCGCTAIGWFIGRSVDKGKPPRQEAVARGEVDTLKVGEAIEIQLWDGRTLRGKYQGLEWATPADYGPRYEGARKKLEPGVPLPTLGPGARMVVTSGVTAKGDFRGVGPGFVRFVEPGQPEASIKTHRIVTLADASGHAVSGAVLDKLLSERSLPTLAGLRLDSTSQVVDYADVAGVSRLVRPSSGRTTGALVGLAIDAAVVAVFVHEMNQMTFFSDPCAGNSCGSSCPLVDSFDGREWVLDAEPLGGAFYRAAERTEVARLARIEETNGRYRVRLRNDQQEIDHLDAVALRVVDHPRGTEIVPDALGQLHAVRHAQAPVAGSGAPYSRDRRTGPVAALVAAADGNAWVSEWRGRDPSLAADLRDGVELQYRRPPGAASAVLVARVGATPLGPRLLAEVLALQGRELGRFYAGLEAEPAAREAFERAREREVLPTVRLFDGKAWRVAGYLRDLPSLVHREQAVPLDLRGVEGESLRLRIDGAPGLFSIDRAVVSFDGEPEVAETRVPAAEATDDAGRDVRDLLNRADGRRHSLRPGRDSVTLVFPAPRLRAGQARTVLVEATGYYNVIVRPEGAPQPELFRRLLEEPGGVARFALEHLRDEGRNVAVEGGRAGLDGPR